MPGLQPDMVELSDEQRAELVAQVEASDRMPQDVKARMLGQLERGKGARLAGASH